MKIYFAGSIRGGRQDLDLYLEIINHLKTYGEVLTEHIGDASLTSFGENNTSDKFIHDRDIDWLFEADIVVAEVTNPSLGVGYELGRALENNTPVLTLFRPSKDKKLSAMISGAPGFKNFNYTNVQEAQKIIDAQFS